MKSCETCLYRATHEKCNGCLTAPAGEPYPYRNWVESTLGEALERIHAMEVSGERNIVIGGSGEAEVNAKWTAREAYEHLCHVSECCGYYTAPPIHEGDETRIEISGGDWCGSRVLVWKSGAFDRIQRANGRLTWSRYPEHIRTALGDMHAMNGTPKSLIV